MAEHNLKARLESIGWFPRDSSFWNYCYQKKPRVAIVAPPLDSVPSRVGNGIYTLVERIALYFPEPIIILARDNGDARKIPTLVNEKILYTYPKRMDNFLRSKLPYRVKKYFWASSVENVNQYFYSAGKACKMLGVDFAIIEDETKGVLTFNRSSPGTKLLLHQHQISPLSLSAKEWEKVNRFLAGLIFVSQKTAKQVENKFGFTPIMTRVIYNGVDLTLYNPLRWVKEANSLRSRLDISSKTKVLLYVGRLVPQKGVLEALKAFQKSNLQDACFVIIGDVNTTPRSFSDAAYIKEIKAFIDYMPGQIVLTGGILQEQLPPWYKLADILLVPSIGEEGLPKVINEALAMGCPVIATDRGGNWEIIRNGENGWYLQNPKNIDEFAQLFTNIFSDDKSLSIMRERILNIDRPKMDEIQMVSEFADLLSQLRKSG